MSIKLPSEKGERVTVWEGLSDGAESPVRVVATSDGRGHWSMTTETAYPAENDDPGAERWTDGDFYI